jgi:predicted acyltransferase
VRPLFLFLAGVSVALSAASKIRKTSDRGAASRAVARRGIEVFVLAFLFHGALSSDLHRALTLGQARLAWAAFAFLMLCLSLAKDRTLTLVQSRSLEGPQ